MPLTQTLLNFVLQYRYVAVFLLACAEGQVVGLFMGFMVHAGYFTFIGAYIAMILGDIVPDIAFYFLGRYGNKKNLIEKYSAKSKILKKNAPLLEKLWHHHGKKTMFFSKLAYGMSSAFLISAGLVNLPLKEFLSYAIPVTLFQYAVVISLGYYLGQSYEFAAKYVKDVGYIIAAAVIIFIAAYFLLQRYAKRQITEIENEENL